VEQALDAGFRGIDTACQPKHYDEPGVGAGLAAALAKGLGRDEIYVQTKFTPLGGQDPARVPYDPGAPLARQVGQSFERSCANLGVSVLDGLVLHSPLATPAALQEVWQAMEAIVDSGGARQLGISNCYSPQLFRNLCDSARIKPSVIQNRFYDQTGYDRAIRDDCRRHGILYQSFWTLTANPHILAHDTVKTLAARYGLTTAQVLFAYLGRIGIVPLTGTSSALHMTEDLEAFSTELTEAECAAMDALFV
jgi:diketogulonate reductase-like aldo/keto reductase